MIFPKEDYRERCTGVRLYFAHELNGQHTMARQECPGL